MKRKLLSIMVCAVMVAAMTLGCSSGKEETSGDAAKKDDSSKGKTYGVSVMTMNNSFFVAEVEGIKANIGPDDEVIAPDPALDAATQVDQICDMVSSGVDVIMVDSIDSDGIKPALEAADKAGIPVIAIDTRVTDEDLVACTIVSDNTDAGRIAGKALMEAIGGKGKIAILDHSTVACVQERTAGLEEIMEDYPDVKVVFRQDANGNVTEAQTQTETSLQGDPDLAGVFAINDPTASGAIAALKGANNKDIKVVAIDGSQDAIDMIKAGDLLCTAAQFPDQIGAKAVEVAKAIFAGEKHDSLYVIPVEEINADNAADYDGKQF